MAVSTDARLFLAIFLISYCFTQAVTDVPSDCCLNVKNKEIVRRRVVDYSQQISGQGCFIDATVFVTKRGVNLCVPPGEPWVQKMIKYLDGLKKHCKKNNYKNRRCSGLKRDI